MSIDLLKHSQMTLKEKYDIILVVLKFNYWKMWVQNNVSNISQLLSKVLIGNYILRTSLLLFIEFFYY